MIFTVLFVKYENNVYMGTRNYQKDTHNGETSFLKEPPLPISFFYV